MPRARTVWKVVLALCAVLVALAIGLAAYTDHVMRSTFEARAAGLRAALAAHRNDVLEDQRLLASLPMFASRSGNRDAGPLIGPRVHWMLAAGRPNPASVAGMTLDPSVIGTLGDGWMHAGPDVWSGIDFGWMVSLAEYDYWDVDRNAVPPEPDSWSDTEPDSRELWAWSKLRIAKGVHEHALAPALAEVQELARLCLTVERFPTQLAGIAMLRQVRRAAEAEAPALSSRTADAESTDRMLRAISAARGFARLETPASYEADLAKVVVGRCAALHDGLRTALLVRAQLREARPADYQHLERLLSASPDCRLASVRKRWALPDDERSSQPKPWLDRILTRRSGEIMLSVAEQDWFRLYEKRAP